MKFEFVLGGVVCLAGLTACPSYAGTNNTASGIAIPQVGGPYPGHERRAA